MGKFVIVVATFMLMVEFGVSSNEILDHLLLSSIPKDSAGPNPFLAFGVIVGSAVGFLAPRVTVWYLLKDVPPGNSASAQ